jgi:hypothetical protein
MKSVHSYNVFILQQILFISVAALLFSFLVLNSIEIIRYSYLPVIFFPTEYKSGVEVFIILTLFNDWFAFLGH